ncbi:cyclin-d5-1 [Phtheirospermum japonicum]|uniref:Cyclin-d5-1 n=1 Tax=Phtheirospermum japonicum TaxID=374723 RepID=A0A830B3Y2_9LAMI|nr:cyclin-d5-1 [Phtheirospermum japonicum]
MSFRKETNFRPDSDENQVQKWSKNTRLEALKWILQTRVLFGYHYRTAYLSLIYFDQFFGKTWFSEKPTWTSRILSIACLSIAAKMEEQKARSFTEYHVDGYSFQGIAVQRMELCVFSTLGWNMVVITPFTYLTYFVTKFCVEKSRHQEIVTQAADLVLRIMEEINVAENRPSIVAAASVLAAFDRHLDKTMLENKIDAIPTWGPEEKVQTFSCYCLFQEILMLKTPKSAITPSSSSGVESTITSRGGSKRRLTFDNEGQHFSVKKNFLP